MLAERISQPALGAVIVPGTTFPLEPGAFSPSPTRPNHAEPNRMSPPKWSQRGLLLYLSTLLSGHISVDLLSLVAQKPLTGGRRIGRSCSAFDLGVHSFLKMVDESAVFGLRHDPTGQLVGIGFEIEF